MGHCCTINHSLALSIHCLIVNCTKLLSITVFFTGNKRPRISIVNEDKHTTSVLKF